MLTETDITLYAKSVENNVEKWTRSVIESVHWEDRKGSNLVFSSNAISLKQDEALVYIPLFGRHNVPEIKPGDVMVKGAISQEIGDKYRMSKLNTEYRTMTVRAVDDYRFGSVRMHHLQVSGT